MDRTDTLWRFEHSIECQVTRDFAWEFWTDVNNWAAVDIAVESVSLDGPFAAGTKGTTKPLGLEPVVWELTEVLDGSSALIEIILPGATLKIMWTFGSSSSGGTLITQKIALESERAEDYEVELKELKKGIPQGMQKLAEGIVRAAGKAASASDGTSLRRSG